MQMQWNMQMDVREKIAVDKKKTTTQLLQEIWILNVFNMQMTPA